MNLSRTRYIVVTQSKKRTIPPREFTRKGEAISHAATLRYVGINPKCFEVRLTWSEWFKRLRGSK